MLNFAHIRQRHAFTLVHAPWKPAWFINKKNQMDFNFPTQKQHRIENIFHHDPQCRWDHTQTQNIVQMFICLHMHVYHTHVHLHTFYHTRIRAHTLYMFFTVHAYIHICIMYLQYISSIHIHRFSYIYLNIHTDVFYTPTTRMNPPPNYLKQPLSLFFFVLAP